MNIDNITSDKMGLSVNGMQMQTKVYEQEITRLNNIIDELEKYLIEENKYSDYKDVFYRETMGYVLDKLKELKENKQ